MDGIRLKLVAQSLYPPPVDWQRAIAKALDVPVRRIKDWERHGHVPRAADLALECLLAHVNNPPVKEP